MPGGWTSPERTRLFPTMGSAGGRFWPALSVRFSPSLDEFLPRMLLRSVAARSPSPDGSARIVRGVSPHSCLKACRSVPAAVTPASVSGECQAHANGLSVPSDLHFIPKLSIFDK